MGLVEEIFVRNRRIVRDVLKDVVEDTISVSDDHLNLAVKMLNRDDDFVQVHDKMKSRYAYTVEPAKDTSSDITGSDSGYKTIRRGDVAAAIDAGFMEAVSTGFMSAVCSTLHVLDSDDQKWGWMRDGGEQQQDDEYITELITDVRDRGGFNIALSGADHVACGVEVCYLHPYFQGRDIFYDVVYPQDIKFMPCGGVTEYIDGNAINRIPNASVIEDYGAVVICLHGGGDYDAAPDEYYYQAYIGASLNDRAPLGRCIVFRARDWKQIPDIGDDNIITEYKNESGEICNPLSYLIHGNKYPNYTGTVEYPIIPIRGGHMSVTKNVKPVTATMWLNALEIELGWSKIFKDVQQGASGTKVLKISDMSHPMPESLDVVVLYGDGCDYKNEPLPVSRDHVEMHQSIVKAVAGGYAVPGYTLIGQMPNLSTPESGISLAIQTAPLNRFRQHRIKINKSNIERLYEVERGLLIHGYLGEEGVSAFEGVYQTFDPGDFSAPKDEATRIANAKALLDTGAIDQIEFLRIIHGVTEKEAEDLYAKYKDRDEQYDKPPEHPKQGFGF